MQPQPSVNYERFPSQYFSGSDIRIYFDDVLIDEVTDLTFSMKEKVMPLYGYNSYTYDSVARGSRVIQGSFAINFKDVDYLRSAVRSILNNPEEFDLEDNYPVTENEVNQNFNNVSKEYVDKLHEYAQRGWNTKFDELSQKFEQEIWGSAQNENELNPSDSPYFPTPDFDDKSISFDIVITYGAFKRPDTKPIEEEYYQQINPGTVKSIHNVQLTGLRQLIDSSGKPIKEQYTFLAQDLDKIDNAPRSRSNIDISGK